MNAVDITAKLKTALENASGLGYVKNVWLGERISDIKDSYPNLWIEPGDKTTLRVERGNVAFKQYSCVVVGAIHHPVNEEKAIIGQEFEDKDDQKGIMDLEADVENALNGVFPDLNAGCLYFTYNTSSYMRTDSGEGRMFAMDIVFTYVEQVE